MTSNRTTRNRTPWRGPSSRASGDPAATAEARRRGQPQRRWRRLVLAIASALAFSAAFAQSSEPTTIQLILDASGSMFKTLEDGRYRIVAAKEVLADTISALPAGDDMNVGLRIYGAQTEALSEEACTDSELVVPMQGFDRAALLDAVRGTQARGATPIAYSLELALEDFRGVEGRKLLVLVTDGEESCGGDVRGLVQRLIDEGVDVRIIGFDLSERAVASFAGAGAFEHARSATELAEALGRAVETAAPPVSDTYAITVQVTRDGQPAEGASVTLVPAVGEERYPLVVDEVGTLAGQVPAGQYRADVQDASSNGSQSVTNVTVTPEGENRYTFELAQAESVAVEVSPAEPTAGGNVTVAFQGAPSDGEAWVTVVPADMPDDAFRAWSYVSGMSGSVELGTPPEPEELEARFLVELPEGGSRVLGRSARFTTVAVPVELEAPGEAEGGATFDVTWTGPANEGDYVTIVPQGAPDGAYLSYAYTRDGNPVTLTAPLDPGTYEVRYVAGQGDAPTLASRRIEIVGGTYAVEAPERVPARSSFEVAWTGPSNAGDYITIVPQGAPDGAYLSYAYTYEGNPVTLEAPADFGMYEIRYTTEQGDSPTLASQPIEVLGVDYTLDAPASVAAGESFDVHWTGPDAAGDYITIVPVGAPAGDYLDYRYTSEGSPATLQAPDEPGSYEVRYQSDNADGIFASTPITVE